MTQHALWTCDGPAPCPQTHQARYAASPLPATWCVVQPGPLTVELHFCSWACLAAYAARAHVRERDAQRLRAASVHDATYPPAQWEHWQRREHGAGSDTSDTSDMGSGGDDDETPDPLAPPA